MPVGASTPGPLNVTTKEMVVPNVSPWKYSEKDGALAMATVPGNVPVTVAPNVPDGPVTVPFVVKPVMVAVTGCEPPPSGFN